MRLAAFSEHFTAGNMFSICNSNYEPALDAIVEEIRQELSPGCIGTCAKDIDAETPDWLEPLCIVREVLGNTETVVDECVRESGEYVLDPQTGSALLPEGADLCYALRVDQTMASESALDDIDPECVAEGKNLQLWIATRPGSSSQPGAQLSAQCIVSNTPEVDCG